MDFFDENGKITQDWGLFIKSFPSIGVFRIFDDSERAFIDPNAAAVLSISDTPEKNDIFSVIDALAENPVDGQKNVFALTVSDAQKQILLKMNYISGGMVGFVQDVTDQLNKKAPAVIREPEELNSRERFMKNVHTALAEVAGANADCCLAVLHINGIDRVDSELNYDKTRQCVAAAGRCLEQFESDDILLGAKSYKEYYIFFRQLAKSEIYKLFKSISDELQSCRITDENGNELKTRNDVFSATIGYCWYPSQAGSLDMLINYADFAMYRALSTGSVIKEFDPNEYTSEMMSYSASKELDELIDRNNFEYHFQPIVNANDGKIFAYEALMRPKGSTPLEVLKMAQNNGRLYDIELLTFENVLAAVNENMEKFEGKKIFINSIPECMLKQNDFSRLCETYPDIIPNVVIEFTEQSDLTGERVMKLKDIYRSKGCEIAIDDYGSGYSNSAAMLKLGPEYLKIDRSLIADINKNTRKQHFISGIIDFARMNGIKVLAEGVETFEELSVTIRRGVDLIQGFYTARPSAQIIASISKDIISEIEAVNRTKPEIKTAKTYEINEKSYVPIEISQLTKDKYTDISISCEFAYLKGNGKDAATINIKVADNTAVTLVIEDVVINGGVRQCLVIGENCDVRLDCRGDNLMSYDGIFVPETASLAVIGSGSLKIDSYRNNGCCIGSPYNEPFGKIKVDIEGKLTLEANGDHGVGIGGGVTDADGLIELKHGDIKLNITGQDSVGIGSYDGLCAINLGLCTIDAAVSGDRSAVIGSLNGSPTINAAQTDIKIDTSGTCTVGIGTLASFVRADNPPHITIDGARLEIVFKGQLGAGVGSRSTNCEINISNTDAGIYFEGDKLAGIGCAAAPGTLQIENSNINISSLCGRDSIEIGFHEVGCKVKNSKINNIPVNTDSYTGA